jgi:hypothetical protein
MNTTLISFNKQKETIKDKETITSMLTPIPLIVSNQLSAPNLIALIKWFNILYLNVNNSYNPIFNAGKWRISTKIEPHHLFKLSQEVQEIVQSEKNKTLISV